MKKVAHTKYSFTVFFFCLLVLIVVFDIKKFHHSIFESIFAS